TNSAPNPYQTITGWAKLPEGRMWGSTSAVDVDLDGKSIWVAERCGANSCVGSNVDTVLKFDENGKLLKSFGGGLMVCPHGLHVGANSRLIKFDKTGKFIKEIGKKGSGRGEFDQPHALIMDSRGRLIVGDRGNNRIVVLDQEGNVLEEFYQFSRPSGLAFDKQE